MLISYTPSMVVNQIDIFGVAVHKAKDDSPITGYVNAIKTC